MASKASKDVQVLIPGTCKYVSLCGKRDFADVTKVRILRRGAVPGLSEWAQCHHNVHLRERGRQPSQRRRHDDSSRGQRGTIVSLKDGRVPDPLGSQDGIGGSKPDATEGLS